MMEDSVKTNGSEDQDSWEAERSSDTGGSEPTLQNSVGKSEYVNASSLLEWCYTVSVS